MSDYIQRAATLGEAVGGALSGFGGYLRCRTCGHSQDLGDPGARVMGGGWPKCCTYTMEWITQAQIDRGERPARWEADRG
jgi:hypothetical protein